MSFKKFKLTKQGKTLLLDTSKPVEFTHVLFGDEKLGEDYYESTTIKNAWWRKEVNTVRFKDDENGTDVIMIIGLAFDNSDITEEHKMVECGIFAGDVMIAYSETVLPVGREFTVLNGVDFPRTFEMQIYCTISEELNITANINPNGFLTQEVIESLKNSIANIGFRKFKGVLEAGNDTINVPEGEVIPLTSRAILNIEGYTYIEGVNYTIDKSKNAIVVNQTFEQDMNYEIIDPLPPSYVKAELEEFFRQVEELKKNLDEESEAKLNELLNDLDNHLILLTTNFDKHYNDTINDFDAYYNEKKDSLKGDTGNGIVDITLSEIIGNVNIYDVNYTNGTKNEIAITNGADGVGLDYKWDGTKLGIGYDNTDESEFTYVDLKGDKGDKGDTGPQGPVGPPVEILQETGQSTIATMSQKAITDILETFAVQNIIVYKEINSSSPVLSTNKDTIDLVTEIEVSKDITSSSPYLTTIITKEAF